MPVGTTTERDADLDWRPRIAIAVAVVGLFLPIWAYLGHLGDIGDLEGRAPDLPSAASTPLSQDIRAVRSPWPGVRDALLAIDLTAQRPTTAADLRADLERALEADGYRRWDSFGAHRRPNGSGGDGWSGYDIATIDVDETGQRATVHLATGPWNRRDGLPLAVFAATALSAIAVFAARVGSTMRDVFARIVLGSTVVQASLLLSALSRAKDEIDGYQARFGPLTSEVLFASTDDRPLGLLRQAVSSLTATLYPFGAGTMLLLVPFWVIGVVYGIEGGRRLKGGLLAVGALAAVFCLARYGSISQLIVDINE